MKKFLFLVGPHASGKTYSSRMYIKDRNNIEMIDTGPIMRNLHNQLNPEVSIGEWVNSLEKEYGKDITSKMISKEIENVVINSECDNYILIGFRTLSGIMYTINYLNINDYSILYVDGSYELLYSNFLARENRIISFEDFIKYLDDELNSGLGELKQMALNDRNLIDYYYRTSNDDGFKEQISLHFKQSKGKKLVREMK